MGAGSIGGTQTDFLRSVLELPQLTLAIAAPDGTHQRCPLGLGPVVVGSDPGECDVVLEDPKVSRKHVEFWREQPSGRVAVRDLGSKNGTFIDRVRVERAYIDPNNRVAFGGSTAWLEPSQGADRIELASGITFGGAIGASLSMRALFASLERAAQTDETIVLSGESGTGKEVLARAIHDASTRRSRPFVVFDCSTVTATLAESELFGHVRGAFTGALQAHAGVFEQANGGTLFIDELGELPADLQPKLLRALEARQIRRVGSTEWVNVDVRIVTATHRDLRARVAEGAFRQDLYYRLAVLDVRIPPLRERREDIPLLVEHFLGLQRPPRTVADLPPNALELLQAYAWPGNIRELRNTLARMLLFPTTPALAIGEPVHGVAPGGLTQGTGRPSAFAPASQATTLLGLPLREARDVVVEQFERAYIEAKLGEHAGNVSRTAEAIGVSRQFLHRLLERYRISRT